MRWLKIAYALSRAGKPILLSATLVGACHRGGGIVSVPKRDAADVAVADVARPDAPIGRSDLRGATDERQDAKVIVIGMPDAPFAEALDGDEWFPGLEHVPVPGVTSTATLPYECIDVDAGADAGITALLAEPARVTMAWVMESGKINPLATIGHVRIAPAIASLVVGLPTVELVSKRPDGNGQDPTLANLRADSDGFVFDVAWASPGPDQACTEPLYRGFEPSWTFRTTLRVRCGEQERSIESFTIVTLCGREPPRQWASTGDLCEVCAQVCEMAPSPIVPEATGDDLPLASALHVTVRALARVGGAVVLWADHAPRPDLDYAWQATTGTLTRLDRDVVLWQPSPTAAPAAQLVQVAVAGPSLAAVASYRQERLLL